MPLPTVIAHRGFSGIAPENTLPALQLAIDSGADMVEFDVRTTKDDQLVVIHDATVERTTNGTGYVSQYTLPELQTLDAGTWFSQAFSGTQVPSLKEVLRLCNGSVYMNIEIKTDEQSTEALDRLVNTVSEHVLGMNLSRSVVISSYNLHIVRRLRERHSDMVTALLSDREHFVERDIITARKVGASALHVPTRLVTKQLIDRAREQNLITAVHTVNEPPDMRRIIAMGFDGIFTDYPDRLRHLIQDARQTTVTTAWDEHLSLVP